MKLRDIMTRDVLTLTPRQTASDALALMRDARVRHAVVTSAGEVVGVVSDRDLGGPHGAVVRKQRSVEDLMRTVVVTATPDTTLADAANIVRANHVGCLPIMDGPRLVGIVTRGDLLDGLATHRKRHARPHPEGESIAPRIAPASGRVLR